MTNEKMNLPPGYDWDFFLKKTTFSGGDPIKTQKHKRRIEYLIVESLSRCTKKNVEYELFGKVSKPLLDGYYGIETHEKENICVIFGSERGKKSVVAIFSFNDINIASRYFVSLVSDNEVEIDWSLFLEMLDD